MSRPATGGRARVRRTFAVAGWLGLICMVATVTYILLVFSGR